MRKQARTLATVITGAAAITPLVLVTTFFVMSVWSLGEALMDVKGLLAGKKVKLVKKKDDWTLTIENLISMAKNRNLDAGGGDSGLSYLSWLNRVESGTGEKRLLHAQGGISGSDVGECRWEASFFLSGFCGKPDRKS